MSTKPVITYWGGVASRGHYYSYVLAFNGKMGEVELNNTDIPYPGTDEWNSYSPKSDVGQLPCMTDGDINIGESNAIVRYLCKKFKISEISEDFSLADYAVSEMLIETASGLHGALGKCHYTPDRTGAFDKYFGEGGGFAKVMSAFEKRVPTVMSPGAICLAAALNLHVRLEPECLAKYPELKKLYDAVLANADVQKVNDACPYPYFKRQTDAASA